MSEGLVQPDDDTVMKTGDMVHDEDSWHGDDGWRLVAWFVMKTRDTVMTDEDLWHGSWWGLVTRWWRMKTCDMVRDEESWLGYDG